MAMTEEERRKARNEASKRWYAAHKAAKAAKKPAKKQVEAKPTKKVALKPMKKQKAEKPQNFQKRVAKTVKAFAGPVAKVEKLVKDVAPLLAEIYKAGDEKETKKLVRDLSRGLGLSVAVSSDGKASVEWSVVRTFRVPKTQTPAEEPAENAAPELPPEEPVSQPDEFEESEESEEPVEVPVDPAKFNGIPSGEDAPPVDIDDETQDDEDDEDDLLGGDEDEDEDEDDDEDEDEDEEPDPDDDLEGRAEMMREIEAQGGYDD